LAADTVKKSVRAERRAVWLLDHGRFLGVCETVAGRRGAFTPMTLPDGVPAVQTEHVRALRALYDKALDEGPALLRQALKAMGTSQSAVTGFDLNYIGEKRGPLKLLRFSGHSRTPAMNTLTGGVFYGGDQNSDSPRSVFHTDFNEESDGRNRHPAA
jgi:hypothetical protein